MITAQLLRPRFITRLYELLIGAAATTGEIPCRLATPCPTSSVHQQELVIQLRERAHHIHAVATKEQTGSGPVSIAASIYVGLVSFVLDPCEHARFPFLNLDPRACKRRKMGELASREESGKSKYNRVTWAGYKRCHIRFVPSWRREERTEKRSGLQAYSRL